jgi:hypothetical protein
MWQAGWRDIWYQGHLTAPGSHVRLVTPHFTDMEPELELQGTWLTREVTE